MPSLKSKSKKPETPKYSFQRRKRKQNLSVPLEEATIVKLDEASRQHSISRAELMRFALEYAMGSSGFHDMLKQL